MASALLLGLQAAAATAPAGPPPLPSVAAPIEIAPVEFDISSLDETGTGLLLRTRCSGPDGDVIVVCGTRAPGAGYDFEAMARRYARRPLLAEYGFGGSVTGRAWVESASMDRGAVANRVMVGIRVPF